MGAEEFRVRKVFISYTWQNKPEIDQLIGHLRVLGCDTWVDNTLHGSLHVGQDLWEEILRRIADSDALIAVISPEALDSVMCQREFDWAGSLGKPVVPVAIQPLPGVLPHRLAIRQIIDYSEPEDRDEAGLELASVLATLPAAPPLPDPLPKPPAGPLVYLTELKLRVSDPQVLDRHQQERILAQLETALRSADPEEENTARGISARLHRRKDLDADIARKLKRFDREEKNTGMLAAAVGGIVVPGLAVPLPPSIRHRAGATRDASAPEKPTASRIPLGDRLTSSVFAPPAVEPGDMFMVQVFTHLPAQVNEVAALAREFDDVAQRRGVVRLSSGVKRGEELTFELRLPGLVADDPVQSLVWMGEPESVQFGISVPMDFPPRTVVGTVTISRDFVPVGHVKLKVSVLGNGVPPQSAKLAAGEAMHRYGRAFISYASADRDEVLKRAQMLDRVHIEFFQDLLSIEPGQRWERRLFNEIDRCDLFLLFWSSAAKKSEWVLKEVHYAMERCGSDELAPPEIVPVIIEGPPPVEPPPELAHLHFNDRITYFMQPTQKNWFSRLRRHQP
jgi:hypothetical protein